MISKKQSKRMDEWETARLSTVDYINSEMKNALRFKTREFLFNHVLKKIKKGLVLEFGVFKGESINFIASKLPGITIHGFDSFTGLPESWVDIPKGGFTTFGKPPKVKSNVRLYKGQFKDSLPLFLKEFKDKIAFIHIDSDLYSSAKFVFDTLRGRIDENTIIQFDEYFNYPGWENGEFKAFQEFIKDNDFSYKYLGHSRLEVAVKIKKRNFKEDEMHKDLEEIKEKINKGWGVVGMRLPVVKLIDKLIKKVTPKPKKTDPADPEKPETK